MVRPENRHADVVFITFAQLLTLLVYKEADVAKTGRVPRESLVELNMQWR